MVQSTRRLWLYGLAMLGPLLYFAWRYPLPGNTDRLNDLGHMARYGVTEFVLFMVGMVILFGCYMAALIESQRLPARRALRPVFGFGIVFGTIMAWMFPGNAIDIFLYAVRSRLFTTYGANPLAALPRDYPADPWLHFASEQWSVTVSPYGPLWNLIAAPITLLAGDRMSVALAGFKLLALLSLLAGGWVIARILIRSSAHNAATGTLFYLWNPLVLWEGVGNGHNDVLMTLVLLLALLAWVRRWAQLVIPLLVTATLIKYVTVVLIPIALIALWVRAGNWAARGRIAAWSAVLSMAAVALSLAPFYDLMAIYNSVTQQGSILLTSPAAVAVGLLQAHIPRPAAEQWVRLAGATIVSATLCWQAIILWKRPEQLPRASFEMMYVFLLVATWNFRSWYLIWPVALAALLPWGWPAWRMSVWVAGTLAVYSLFIWIWPWTQADFAVIHTGAVTVMFVPTVVLTIAELVRRTLPTWQSLVSQPAGEPLMPRQRQCDDG